MVDTATTFKMLSDAVENNDFPAFNKEYLTFLRQYDAFRAAELPVAPDKEQTEITVKNPIFGDLSFNLKQTTDEMGEDILKKGRAAEEVFGALSVNERKEFLQILQKRVDAHKAEIELTIVADTGKPITLSKGEVGTKGDEWFKYTDQHIVEQLGDTKVGKVGQITLAKRPLGVVQIISAYNYPYALAIGGITGALAGGNGIVVSAPVKAPNWVFPFQKAADEAVAEFAAKARSDGKSWADDFERVGGGLIQTSIGVNVKLTSAVDQVHFVGSDITGGRIAKSRSMKKEPILEMGGGNVVTVMNSALEIQSAHSIAKAVFDGFGPATGQRCTAPRVLCVQNGEASAVTDEIKKIVAKGIGEKIGNPFKEEMSMGPLVDKGAYENMEKAIALAREMGAEVTGELNVKDGRHNGMILQAHNENAYWVNPVVIDWSKAKVKDPASIKKMTDTIHNEIFGPLLHIVNPINSLGEAIAMTNHYDTHKLAGAIFTADSADVVKYSNDTKVNSLAVNEAPKDRSPEGSHGHHNLATIGAAKHFGLYVNTKTIATNPNVQMTR